MALSLSEYKEFKALYDEAVKKEEVQFEFLDVPVLVSFAKYLIEFYDGKLKAV